MQSQPAVIDQNRYRNLDSGRDLEWLVTNTRGGYAMACVNQMLTRRYHGLLVAAVSPPVERYVLLAKLDATISVDGLTYELATNDYPEAVHPHGYKLLESFSQHPYPTWCWRAGSALIEQSLCMPVGADTTFIRYRLIQGPAGVSIVLRPLCTSRHFHHLAGRQDLGNPSVEEATDGLRLSFGDSRPAWQISHNGTFKNRADWYYHFVLSTEARRGYDFEQDLFMPGTITASLVPNDPTGLVIAASTQEQSWKGWGAAFSAASKRIEAVDSGAISAQSTLNDPLASALLNASQDFIVSHAQRNTIIAGYPWFGDWGRDTFISLPGLCLVPGHYEKARQIIESFVDFVDHGMIPNRFPDYGEAPAYDTADATLWYIHAIDRYLEYSGDWDFVSRKMLPVIAKIIESHENGTRHGVHLADDGLLAAGQHGYALTWMDAKLPDRAITPRIGKPVEISALWYNALCIAASFAQRAGDKNRESLWRKLADRAFAAFNDKFWHPSADCLYDVVDCEGRSGANDATVRPNQLLAISLTHPILDRSRWAGVVRVCERHLWTPMGLRTLSTCDPAYRGSYDGNQTARDEAYHQGTAWPWLLGPFVTAFVRTFADRSGVRTDARKYLDGLLPHLQQAGLGGVSEVAGGDPPHRPDGCPWQAWSVAEPLRAICEDILQTHPAARGNASREIARTVQTTGA